MNILKIDNPKPYMNRAVKTEIIFDVPGTWQALRSAERWCTEKGYGTGSGDYPNPIAISDGPYDHTQKWHNFTTHEKKTCFGIITGDMREGPMTIRIFA